MGGFFGGLVGAGQAGEQMAQGKEINRQRQMSDEEFQQKRQEFQLRQQQLKQQLQQMDPKFQLQQDLQKAIQAGQIKNKQEAALWLQRRQQFESIGITGQKLQDAMAGMRLDPTESVPTQEMKDWLSKHPGMGPSDYQAAMKEKPLKESVQEQEMQDWIKKHPGKGPSDFAIAMKELVPSFSFKLQSGAGGGSDSKTSSGERGEAVLKGVNQGDAGIVRGLAAGRISLPSSFALRTPYWQRIMGLLERYDPDFSEQRAQIRKSFTTGPDGKNIGALNTATVHLDTLNEAAKALSNGNLRPGNAAYNRLKTEFGMSAPTSFEGIRSAVSGEMATALKGQATDVEIANISRSIEAQNSPGQLADYIKAQMHILGQKMETYKERYEQQIPNDTVWSPVLPQAQRVFEKHGIQDVGGGGGGPKVYRAINPKTGKVHEGTTPPPSGWKIVGQ